MGGGAYREAERPGELQNSPLHFTATRRGRGGGAGCPTITPPNPRGTGTARMGQACCHQTHGIPLSPPPFPILGSRVWGGDNNTNVVVGLGRKGNDLAGDDRLLLPCGSRHSTGENKKICTGGKVAEEGHNTRQKQSNKTNNGSGRESRQRSAAARRNATKCRRTPRICSDRYETAAEYHVNAQHHSNTTQRSTTIEQNRTQRSQGKLAGERPGFVATGGQNNPRILEESPTHLSGIQVNGW